MEQLLPSEIARLVYGYMLSSGCEQSADMFLNTSKYLKECLEMKRINRKFHTTVNGLTLIEMLDEYMSLRNIVENAVQSSTDKRFHFDASKNIISLLKDMLCRNDSKNSVTAQNDIIAASNVNGFADSSAIRSGASSSSSSSKTVKDFNQVFHLTMSEDICLFNKVARTTYECNDVNDRLFGSPPKSSNNDNVLSQDCHASNDRLARTDESKYVERRGSREKHDHSYIKSNNNYFRPSPHRHSSSRYQPYHDRISKENKRHSSSGK